MPVISVPMGNTIKEQKKELIEMISTTAIEIINIPAQALREVYRAFHK